MEDKPQENGARVRLPPPLAFSLCAVVGAVALWGVFRLSITQVRLPRIIAALGCAVSAIALFASTLRLFRRSGQDPRPWKPSPEMIVEGPYRFSRNPMYVGMLLVQLSLGMALNSLWIVLLSPVALGVVHLTAVLPEERYLAGRFGKGYEQYRRRVRRYF